MDFEQRQILAYLAGGIIDLLLLIFWGGMFGYLGISLINVALALMVLRGINGRRKK